jgi:hypothetical protein
VLSGEAVASPEKVRSCRVPLVILLFLAVAQILLRNQALTRAIELVFLIWVSVPGGKFIEPRPHSAHP